MLVDQEPGMRTSSWTCRIYCSRAMVGLLREESAALWRDRLGEVVRLVPAPGHHDHLDFLDVYVLASCMCMLVGIDEE